MISRLDRFKGALRLAAIGDALGWLTEFERTPEGLMQRYGVRRIEGFLDWRKRVGGPYLGYEDFIKAGSYSDDTQLGLAVARCLMADGSVDHERFAKLELPAWLHYDRGGGRTVKQAAAKAARKRVSWWNNFYEFKVGDEVVDYRDCGANGVAMRVLPIALACHARPEQVRREVFANGIVTHGHPRAIASAILLALAVGLMLEATTLTFSGQGFMLRLRAIARDLAHTPCPEGLEFAAWRAHWDQGLDRDFEATWVATCQELEAGLVRLAEALTGHEELAAVAVELGGTAPLTRGAGTVTVLLALLVAAAHAKEPAAGILAAVNLLGTDTDSIASMAGGLLGAMHGDARLPEGWQQVQDYAYLTAVATDLEAIASGTAAVSMRPQPSPHPLLELKVGANPCSGQRVCFAPLGSGVVEGVKQVPVATRGKLAVLVKVAFEVGQTCIFSTIRDATADEPERVP